MLDLHTTQHLEIYTQVDFWSEASVRHTESPIHPSKHFTKQFLQLTSGDRTYSDICKSFWLHFMQAGFSPALAWVLYGLWSMALCLNIPASQQTYPKNCDIWSLVWKWLLHTAAVQPTDFNFPSVFWVTSIKEGYFFEDVASNFLYCKDQSKHHALIILNRFLWGLGPHNNTWE